MATYTVKTITDRNLVIEANRFSLDPNTGTYTFYTTGDKVVASVPCRDVFAIVDDTADKCDYYYSDRELDDNFKPPASGFEYSEDLFNFVWDVIESWHDPDAEGDPENPENGQTAESEEVGPIETRVVDGELGWGFVTPNGFVNFGNDKGIAESSRVQYINGRKVWFFTPLDETEVVQ